MGVLSHRQFPEIKHPSAQRLVRATRGAQRSALAAVSLLPPMMDASHASDGHAPRASVARSRFAYFTLLWQLMWSALRGELITVNVSGESMTPLVREGDVLFCSRSASRLLRSVVLHEVRLSMRTTARHVKRLTGLAGDIRGHEKVSSGYAWLEGDNATSSTDSRTWGPVPLTQISAVAIALLRGNRLEDLRPRTGSVRPPLTRRAIDAWRDWSRGVSTRDMHRADQFGFSPFAYYPYVPTPWEVGRAALESLSVGRGDVFVDYGCGKGRMLAIALERGVIRAVGVEVVPELAAEARRNLRRFGERADVRTADAALEPLPDDATVVYIFNSFASETLRAVVAQVRASVLRRPRMVSLLTFGVSRAVLSDVANGVACKVATNGVTVCSFGSQPTEPTKAAIHLPPGIEGLVSGADLLGGGRH